MWARFFWMYLVLPAATLLPNRWRGMLRVGERVNWERAAVVSGFLEIAVGIFGMCFWYMQAMAPMISTATDWALSGKFGRDVTEHQIAGAALVVFASHPLTWLLLYAFLEGGVRLCGAAFMEDVRGSFPLYLLERMVFLVKHRAEVKPGEILRQHAAATAQALRERAMVAGLPEVPDELHSFRGAGEEILEISASRRKEDWVPPKIVRVDEAYYRLEDSSVEAAPRPFRYRLWRLEAGVPGRNVILYKSAKAAARDEESVEQSGPDAA